MSHQFGFPIKLDHGWFRPELCIPDSMNLTSALNNNLQRFLLKDNMASKILNPGPSSPYERMSGGCTRIVAAEMISSVSPPIDSSSYILDNACGPGIITEQVKLLHPDAKIMATD